MRVWTIQPLCVWSQIETEGIAYVEPEWVTGKLTGAYGWLSGQLHRRIDRFAGPFPWWAYCTKPDLREYRHMMNCGERHVRIELEPTPGSFLTFPGWAWNRVFTGNYLAFTLAEQQDWEWRLAHAVPDYDCWPYPEPLQTELEATWLRLFSSELPPRSFDLLDSWYGEDAETREAVLGPLRRHEVRSVTHFTGCWKRRR